MARIFVNGASIDIAATYRTAATITAITNASPAVATLGAGHGTVVGDFVEIVSSGWSRLIGRVFRVSVVSTNDVTLEGCNTTDTTRFPSGAGAGQLRAGLTYAQVAQINEFTVDGGEQQFVEGQYIDNPLAFRFPSNVSPVNIEFNVDDDQSLAFWAHVRASADGLSNRMIRVAYPGGTGRFVGTGIWTLSAAPAMAINQAQKRTISIALAAQITEYTT